MTLMNFLCFLLTRVGNVNDSVFFDSGQLDRLDDRLDLKPDKEVGKEAKDILPKNNEIKIKSFDYVCYVRLDLGTKVAGALPRCFGSVLPAR